MGFAINSKEWYKLVLCIIACEAAGAIGAIFTYPAVRSDWYPNLAKPAFTPPNALFAPVWLTLYFLMGIAVYLIWRHGLACPKPRQAFTAFCIQLGLNLFWTIVFFGLKSIFGGVVIILALWLTILVMIILAFRVSKTASWLLVPYIVWVSIASYLNIGVWRLN